MKIGRFWWEIEPLWGKLYIFHVEISRFVIVRFKNVNFHEKLTLFRRKSWKIGQNWGNVFIFHVRFKNLNWFDKSNFSNDFLCKLDEKWQWNRRYFVIRYEKLYKTGDLLNYLIFSSMNLLLLDCKFWIKFRNW